MTLTVEMEQGENGRWIADVVDLPGVLAYGTTSEEAKAKVQALALRVIADRLKEGEAGREPINISIAAGWASGRALAPEMSWQHFFASVGLLNDRLDLTPRFPARAGRILYLLLMTMENRSSDACSNR